MWLTNGFAVTCEGVTPWGISVSAGGDHLLRRVPPSCHHVESPSEAGRRGVAVGVESDGKAVPAPSARMENNGTEDDARDAAGVAVVISHSPPRASAGPGPVAGTSPGAFGGLGDTYRRNAVNSSVCEELLGRVIRPTVRDQACRWLPVGRCDVPWWWRRPRTGRAGPALEHGSVAERSPSLGAMFRKPRMEDAGGDWGGAQPAQRHS